MINPEELQKVINKLLVKTKLKELDWKFDSDSQSVTCDFPRSSIIISKQNLKSTSLYHFMILNESGDSIGDISTFDPSERFHQAISEIFAQAERQALNVDETLNDIFSNLE